MADDEVIGSGDSLRLHPHGVLTPWRLWVFPDRLVNDLLPFRGWSTAFMDYREPVDDDRASAYDRPCR